MYKYIEIYIYDLSGFLCFSNIYIYEYYSRYKTVYD